MLSKPDIGQLLSDQLGEYITAGSSRKPALIEPECYDDEDVCERLYLNRWQDRGLRNG